MDAEENERGTQHILNRQLNIYNHKQKQALSFMRAILAVVIVFGFSLIVRIIQNFGGFISSIQAFRAEFGSESFAPKILIDASSLTVAVEGITIIFVSGLVFSQALSSLRGVLNSEPPEPFLGGESNLAFPHQISGYGSETDWNDLIYANARRLRKQQKQLEDAYNKAEDATALIVFGLLVVTVGGFAVGRYSGYTILISSFVLTFAVSYLGIQLIIVVIRGVIQWVNQEGWNIFIAFSSIKFPEISGLKPEIQQPVLTTLFAFLTINSLLALLWWEVLLSSEQSILSEYGLAQFGIGLPLAIYATLLIVSAVTGIYHYISAASLKTAPDNPIWE
ncbi:hypothetical protein [Halobellus rufus]|uniref:hypothetical protein n=1 Tax=Halobellus rufus TaxID=1448860 RepID=UPI0012E01EA9|nr:hypothetical protein [Halobellus rufus]